MWISPATDTTGSFIASQRGDAWQIAHVTALASSTPASTVEGVPQPTALVLSASASTGWSCSAEGPKLYWFAPEGGRPTRIVSDRHAALFRRHCGGQRRTRRVFLAGTDGAPFGGRHQVLMLDAEGNSLGGAGLDEAPTGVAANRAQLLVTTVRGLLRFDGGQSVPRESSEVRAELMTPMLQSPATRMRGAGCASKRPCHLPPGSVLEISYAATDDIEIRERRWCACSRTRSMPAGQRLARMRAAPGRLAHDFLLRR